MKIAVAGIGYVGLANAVLLAQNNEVVTYDVNEKKVEMIAHNKAPFADEKIQEYLTCKQLNLKATNNYVEAFGGAEETDIPVLLMVITEHRFGDNIITSVG